MPLSAPDFLTAVVSSLLPAYPGGLGRLRVAIHAGGGNLLETREAKDGLALLRFLAEPADEVALVAVLRSPFFAVDERALHELAEKRERGSSWWEVVRGTSDDALSHARKVLK